MPLDRRFFVLSTAVLGGAALLGTASAKESSMYGVIGKMLAKPGERDALADILLAATIALPGCLSYVIAKDGTDADALWITEVWVDEASHQASLTLPGVQAAIGRARPIIAGFGERFVTTPLGGTGLSSR